MKQINAPSFRTFAVSVCAFLLVVVSSCAALGSREERKNGSAQTLKAGVQRSAEPRLLAAYVVDDIGSGTSIDKNSERNYIEGSYVPQAVAAYFPTRFSASGNDRRLSFDQDLSFRVMSNDDLGEGVRVYTVETWTAVTAGGGGKRYSISFPRSALGAVGGSAVQPAPYALERAARMTGATSGMVRLETLKYTAGQFRATVIVE
ncbi:MAG: hypothetical protein A2Z99_06210 [Treponema sp. GWB1_62_6]|nr:MAG: hypothetical protein A2Y36_00450 [Treponema sp. GWA1_62_8]OHE64503.1 MAG: hypothetical protein A2001_03060 [Treponema sp. GWC1_61_84]OHE64635.1 MAG: hypothetical protein A2Z99_06210 [Treponema sp. GWB1_62_6]OHE71648.1 MAG: hypothetical protein A2413_02045 [Treponema sp. RIFOXYC1_FULL_61_9]HCM25142.1 hypothetical protein [Treponema sp.]